ncbi:MAG TPA: FtsX-like permease family protein [Gemmatimonadaceae bacterium]|jgi:ABC-type antimicrobial peptide transport system permease subunit
MELREPARPIVYLPLTAWFGESLGAANLVVRTAGDPRNAAQSVRDAIARVLPGIRLRRVQTADQALAEALPRERLAASLALLFGTLALLLAGVGLYGVVSYDVTRRSKEIGIRTALGATAGDAVMLVLRDAATMCAIGLMLGVLPALALGRAFAAQLYGIESMDPRVVVGAMAVLAIAALVASLGPGIRAARVDPLVAIRTD